MLDGPLLKRFPHIDEIVQTYREELKYRLHAIFSNLLMGVAKQYDDSFHSGHT